MVGLGETEEEIYALLDDLKAHNGYDYGWSVSTT
jgi:lipoate synthase